MRPELGTRIEAMYRSDRLCAWLFVLVLWVVIGFVLLAMWGLIDDPAARAVLVVAAVLVLLFNTASIAALGAAPKMSTHWSWSQCRCAPPRACSTRWPNTRPAAGSQTW